MTDDIELSEAWTQTETEAVAQWTNDGDETLTVYEENDQLIVALQREVSVDGYTADIDTITLGVQTTDDATKMVERIATEVDDSIGNLTAIGAEEDTIDGDRFVEFYCVFEDIIDDVDVDDLVFENEYDGDITATYETISVTEIDEEEAEEMQDPVELRVEIYPVHESEVTFDE